MFKKLLRFPAVVVITAIFTLLIANPTVASADPAQGRIAGGDRYDTAVQIAQQGWTTSDVVILAAGMDGNLVDALSAAPLAKLKDAPILFSAQNGLTSGTLKELKRLKTKKVYLVTGKDIFDQRLFEQLEGVGVTVTHLGGGYRFQTSINIAR